MSSPILQSIVLMTGQPMGADAFSARIDSGNYISGMLSAIWTGNDAFDGVVYVQGSPDGVSWGNMGSVTDDVGSVTMNTANDNQLWAFPQGFPFPFLRTSFTHGTNTAGTLVITFYGYVKALGS